MKTITVFNNKGGVGKTTLTFHLAHALSELNKKTLIIDLDPQCSLTILGMEEETLHKIWEEEDDFISDFKQARSNISKSEFNSILQKTRSIHFLLKPIEDGVTDELDKFAPPYPLAKNLGLIPGRLSMHMYENKIAGRWSEVYLGDPLAIRTITKIRDLASEYHKKFNYEYIIFDTSPSLGVLNKVAISITDGFVIPCMPDMFSLYGIRNIGNSLKTWKKEFDTIYHLVSSEKRKNFPDKFVRLLGYTIYNARKYAGQRNDWELARAHYNYAMKIPETIKKFIDKEIRSHLQDRELKKPIGGTAIMHSHSTLPNMAQKYHLPMWKVPSCSELSSDDKPTIIGNKNVYEATKEKYAQFANDLISRLDSLDDEKK